MADLVAPAPDVVVKMEAPGWCIELPKSCVHDRTGFAVSELQAEVLLLRANSVVTFAHLVS